MDPLLMLSREIQHAFASHSQTVGVFFDLEKAYDTTWRAGILKQLVSWRIAGNMFNCLKDFLSDRFLKVRVGSEFSSLYRQEEGLPQGSVLSVTLFSIAINSLMEHVPPGVQSSLFADDFVVYCSGYSAVDVCQKIQVAINAATNWAKVRGFKFSTQKTKAIRFTRLRHREEIPTLFMNGSILPFEEEVRYLGIILDKKLNFNSHINDLAIKVKHRFNVLKVVSCYNWGADRTTLLRIYLTLCLSKIDYGCQIYGSASKTSLEKLDVIHNMALRICTGAFRTSPIDSLYVDAGFSPLHIRREELGLRLLSRILTSPQNPNYKYAKQPNDRSANRPRLPKPLEVRLQDSALDIGLLPCTIKEITPSKFPHWRKPPVDICEVKYKRSNPSSQSKAEFNAHINQHPQHMAIYTDGSKSSEGVGFAIITNGRTIKKRLVSRCSIFTAEIFAILTALKLIFNTCDPGSRIVIHSDCLSVLTSIKKLMPIHPLVREVQEWLILLHSRKRIKTCFCWVPSHVGIGGNELADEAAKEAVRLPNFHKIEIPHCDFKEVIRSFSREKWQQQWSRLNTNTKLRAIRPSVLPWQSSSQRDRRATIVLTRLRIGHTYYTHKYLLTSGEGRQPPYCNVCNTNVTVKHILVECVQYSQHRIANTLNGMSLQQILNDDTDVHKVLKFLKDIGLFFEI